MVVLFTGAKLSVCQVNWIWSMEVKEESEMVMRVGCPESKIKSLPSPILFLAIHLYLPKSGTLTLSTMRLWWVVLEVETF